MSPPTELMQDVCLNVRKAYRLLHDYQRMVLDAAIYIGKQLDLNYVGGWSKFSGASPCDGGGNLNLSAWNWLNMVLYEFHFSKKLADGRDLKLSILLISDTGYFCSEHEGGISKENVSDYLSPDKSRTVVGFLISGRDWEHGFSFVSNREQMKTFIESGGTLPEAHVAKGNMGRCYDIAELSSEEETNRLINELVSGANDMGIPLKRLDTKV